MTMEIELKYIIDNKELLDQIWQDEYIKEIEEAESRETLFMKAAYFDTEDFILSKNDIAFRVRMEGSNVIASLKWNDEKTIEAMGLHTREELNVPVDDEACFLSPDPALFKESDVGEELMLLLKGKKLISILETRFLRNRVRIDTGTTIMEVSVDDGEIVTTKGNEPIRELEIELFTGEKDELIAIGEKFAEKYDLKPESRSKYARGLELIRKKSDI